MYIYINTLQSMSTSWLLAAHFLYKRQGQVPSEQKAKEILLRDTEKLISQRKARHSPPLTRPPPPRFPTRQPNRLVWLSGFAHGCCRERQFCVFLHGQIYVDPGGGYMLPSAFFQQVIKRKAISVGIGDTPSFQKRKNQGCFFPSLLFQRQTPWCWPKPRAVSVGCFP